MNTIKFITNVAGFTIRRSLLNVNTNIINIHPVTNSSITGFRHYYSRPSEENLNPVVFRNITKDRSTSVPVETSIKYVKSDAYKQTYGTEPVWTQYRRNHKGALPPRKTRKTCIRKNVISTGNPCPICRDEYLVLNENNVELLQQFISPHTGAVLSYQTTGLCQKRHQELLISVQRARNRGLITFDVPFRKYNYSDYYKLN